MSQPGPYPGEQMVFPFLREDPAYCQHREEQYGEFWKLEARIESDKQWFETEALNWVLGLERSLRTTQSELGIPTGSLGNPTAPIRVAMETCPLETKLSWIRPELREDYLKKYDAICRGLG